MLIWSCGNESFGGSVIRDMSNLFRSLDPRRLVHYEGISNDRSYDETSDIESRMYLPVVEVEKWLAEHPGKPMINCEYTHAMGNSCGAMHKYTDLTDREARYQGGFIWDYVDQSLYQKDRFGREYQAYGGDCGERPTDYNFSGNGIVYGGDRAPSPKMQEVKYNYQNISVDFDERGFTVKNKNLFVDTDRFAAWAILLADGEKCAELPLSISVPPLSEKHYPIPAELTERMAAREAAAITLFRPLPEFALTVSFRLRADTLWASTGHEVAFGQKVFRRGFAPHACTAPLTVVRGKWNVGVRGAHFSAQFSALRPGLTSYVYGGVERIEKIPMPNFWRAPTDNDCGNGMPQRYAQWKIASLYAIGLGPGMPLYPQVEEREHSVCVTFVYQMPTVPASGCALRYEVFGDGTVETTLSYKAVEGLGDMPEFGVLFKFSADLDRVIWYMKRRSRTASPAIWSRRRAAATAACAGPRSSTARDAACSSRATACSSARCPGRRTSWKTLPMPMSCRRRTIRSCAPHSVRWASAATTAGARRPIRNTCSRAEKISPSRSASAGSDRHTNNKKHTAAAVCFLLFKMCYSLSRCSVKLPYSRQSSGRGSPASISASAE